MTLAVIHARSLVGLLGPPVEVEVHLASGLPSFTLVGLADTEVKEARERVRAALVSCGFAFPFNKRVTVNLAPADLPKDSGRFDLPIALGLLAAQGLLDVARLERCEFAGELSLAGELRPVRGAFALALAASRDDSPRTLVLPAASAEEAAQVERLDVRGAETLQEIVLVFSADAGAAGAGALRRAMPRAARPAPSTRDLRDVRGQSAPKRALEIAAAGLHSLLLVGPPGTGKSMLAERLSDLLPPMNEDEALGSAALQSLSASGFDPTRWRQRPYRAPHHSATRAALVGGGAPLRPGEISLAHGGVLFLDELPEFPRAALEALREPLETGHITISRAARQARFPARFQLVAAMNPCPCGWQGVLRGGAPACRCTHEAISRYQGRLSGPLLDRIDMIVEVGPLSAEAMLALPEGEGSAVVAGRAAAANRRQTERQGCANGRMETSHLDEARLGFDAAAIDLLHRASERLGWSGRGLHRTMRVARTIADLDAAKNVSSSHLAEALQYRRGMPAD